MSSGEVLFNNLDFAIQKEDKIAVVGNNGVGKSTLLKIITGVIPGQYRSTHRTYYVPQDVTQFDGMTVAAAIGIEQKLKSLKRAVNGVANATDIVTLDDDWLLEERCQSSFEQWGLKDVHLDRAMATLSGGQKTKVLLSGIIIHQPELVLLDEPSNHLDRVTRQKLYEYIASTTDTLLVVSHDRSLLNLLNVVCEISKGKTVRYGGGYDFYVQQKQIEKDALIHGVKIKEQALKKAAGVERELVERKQKLDARGKKRRSKVGLPKIVLNVRQDNAEKSTARLKGVHAVKIGVLSDELKESRAARAAIDKIRMNLISPELHAGKEIILLNSVNHTCQGRLLWSDPIDLAIYSGDRVALKGPNGSGKTTLIKIMLGQITPAPGSIVKIPTNPIYIDQDYSLITPNRTVYEQAQHFNGEMLQEHEVKIRLNRFLFGKNFWDRKCNALSGGEKMRLVLCCLMIGNQSPDVMVLDEPTNNLDLQNIGILTSAIKDYTGTLIVVSHDDLFLEEIGITRDISMA